MPHHEPPAAAADQPLRTIAILATMMAFRTGTTLAALAAAGTLQCEGEAKVEISAGDVIWCPPGHKHRHGATAATSMPHIAVQEALDGVNARPAFALNARVVFVWESSELIGLG